MCVTSKNILITLNVKVFGVTVLNAKQGDLICYNNDIFNLVILSAIGANIQLIYIYL